ncbi:alanine dehydrogenase [Salipiger sp.]|uniref:alanine dehydrogenase n=1 Tax=Salipiger sp. TaxID=2078585 RepID=UPI003A968BDA
MKIGCPTEIKPQEYRVGLTPNAVRELVGHGHAALIQRGAGLGAGFEDADYLAAGAEIAADAAEVFATADMIVKVKEPQAAERALLREGQILFTYLHLAPDPDQTRDLLASGATCIAYETVTDVRGGLPLLAPMSEVAGRLAPQMGAWTLQKANGGRGVLMGGVPGVGPANVVVIGGGVVGTFAARVAAGMGAEVTVLDRSLPRLRYLDDVFGGMFSTRYASAGATADLVAGADMVIGAVLVPGAAAPKLVSRAQLGDMKHGAVLVDVAIDQGGCFETSRATTHDDPVYEVDGIRHYCVANMPGAVPRTSTIALGNATLPFVLALADKGWAAACREDTHLLQGLNIHAGRLTNAPVGLALGIDATTPDDALEL